VLLGKKALAVDAFADVSKKKFLKWYENCFNYFREKKSDSGSLPVILSSLA
jgi:hypothetical protein